MTKKLFFCMCFKCSCIMIILSWLHVDDNMNFSCINNFFNVFKVQIIMYKLTSRLHILSYFFNENFTFVVSNQLISVFVIN